VNFHDAITVLGASWEAAPSLGDVRSGKAPLRKGMQGDAVSYLQQRLGGVKVDGYFGDDTEAAVRAFQAKYLPDQFANGVVGDATMLAIEAHGPTAPAPKPQANTAAASNAVSQMIQQVSASKQPVTDAPQDNGTPAWKWIVGAVAGVAVAAGVYKAVK